MSSSRLLALVPLAAVALLTACAPTVPLDPADDSNDPGCAAITVRLPDAVADLGKRSTDAQATGAWGDPAAVLLRCGVPTPGPTTMKCLTVNNIDWIEDDSDAPQTYRLITFGRTPATEVIVDASKASPATVLSDLSNAIASVPATEHCTTSETAPPEDSGAVGDGQRGLTGD